jgi:hypothetical protein
MTMTKRAQQRKQPTSFRFSPKLSSQGWRKLSKKESKANPDSYTLTHLKNIIDRVYGNRLSLLKQAQNADEKLYSILRKKFSHKINKTLSKVAIAEKLVDYWRTYRRVLHSEHVSKLSRSDEHELDGFISLMERTEAICLAEQNRS